jgi:cell division protein ZipA
MDIKNWILIGGGLLLAAVVGHGFWLAWRGRRDTLRMDIDPNVPREEVDELVLLRAELPNGGARVRSAPQEQVSFELEPDAPVAERAAAGAARREPFVAQRKTMPRREPVARPLNAQRNPSRLRSAPTAQREPRGAERVEPASPADEAPKPAKSVPNDVIVINVLARGGAKFRGAELLDAFLRNGLKFGDMNIFHRIDPTSKVMQFSVASAIEPGTFDLSTMEEFATPGVSFFMRLPGPDEPLQVFEDMLTVSRDVAASLGADLKDEQLSVMTTQTIQHCRSRIEDFSRKRMSQRA